MGNAKTEKRKAQKQRKREREWAKKKAAEFLHGACSWKDAYSVISNLADGNCGIWAVFLHALLDGGMDARTAQEVLSLKGASPDAREAMKGFMILCRERVVNYARLTGQTFYPADGPARTDEELQELLRSGKIKSQSEWEFVHLMVNAFFDEEGVRLLGELFGLQGTRVVMEGIAGQLVDVNAVELPTTGPPLSNLILHRGTHFESMVPKVKHPLIVAMISVKFVLEYEEVHQPPASMCLAYKSFLAFFLFSPGKHEEAQR